MGFIDLSTFPSASKSKENFLSNKKNRQTLIKGQEYVGTIIMDGHLKKIQCEAYRFPLKIEGNINEEFYEDETVSFTAQSRPNDNNPSKTYWFATNIKLKEK